MADRPYTVPPFAEACIDAAGSAWTASFSHPFVRALASGELDADRFRFYQMQDARYLEAFADASALVSTRCRAPNDKLWFLDSAKTALEVEGQLHAGYGKKLGYDAKDIAELVLTPNNRAYQNHMVAAAQQGALVEAVAALSPCPWLYVELGQQLVRELGAIDDAHPYADWLRMYADPGFNAYMNALLERLQRFADAADLPTRQRALEAFAVSARYEWMFWDQAWNQQTWPV